MVSHSHKCIFIHIPKAAGTSIEYFFLKDLNLDLYNRHALLLGENTNKNVGPRRLSHITAGQLVELNFVSEEIFHQYYKFSFVRNPIDRLYSTYKYFKFNDYISFNTFVIYKLENLFYSDSQKHFLLPQYDFLYKNDQLLVDFVGRFESINQDFETVKKALKMEDKSLDHMNKAGNWVGPKSELKSPLYYTIKLAKIITDFRLLTNLSFNNGSKNLSDKAKSIVENLYGMDFKVFNYSID